MAGKRWFAWIATRKWEMRLGVMAALAIGVLLGTLISSGVRASRQNGGTVTPALAVQSPAQLSSTFRDVAQEVEPAVVRWSPDILTESCFFCVGGEVVDQRHLHGKPLERRFLGMGGREMGMAKRRHQDLGDKDRGHHPAQDQLPRLLFGAG